MSHSPPSVTSSMAAHGVWLGDTSDSIISLLHALEWIPVLQNQVQAPHVLSALCSLSDLAPVYAPAMPRPGTPNSWAPACIRVCCLRSVPLQTLLALKASVPPHWLPNFYCFFSSQHGYHLFQGAGAVWHTRNSSDSLGKLLFSKKLNPQALHFTSLLSLIFIRDTCLCVHLLY